MAIAGGISSAPGTLIRSNAAPGLLESARGAVEQSVGDIVVEARLHHENARAGEMKRGGSK